MSDLISRQDAIEAIASRDETDGTVKVFTGREVNEILSALPSADIEEDVARRIATIIENEQDMRVILKNAEQKTGECRTCARNADNGGYYEPEHRTRCPIQEHYALLLDGYCHLYEPYDCGAKMGGDNT